MFSVYCKHCGSVLLLDLSNIIAIRNTPEGIVVRFRCHSGHQGVWPVGAHWPRGAAGRPGSRESAPETAAIPASVIAGSG